MLFHRNVFPLILISSLAISNQALSKCIFNGSSDKQLQSLKDSSLDPNAEIDFHAHSINLLACLGDHDPKVRDDFAFTSLQKLMRDKKLNKESIKYINLKLISDLSKIQVDKDGFKKPFIALTLAEVARYDRKDETLNAEERSYLVNAASSYMDSISDYRGYDEKSGWRHGVAHTADLMMQLGLNPRLTKPQLDQLLISLQGKIAPTSGHAYRYGESSRLARPIIYIASRKLHSEKEWHDWFLALPTSSPYADWDKALSTQKGLAKKHNLEFFLLSMYASIHQSNDQELKSLLLPGIIEAMSKLP